MEEHSQAILFRTIHWVRLVGNLRRSLSQLLTCLILGFLTSLGIANPAQAQMVGQCFDQTRGINIAFRADGYMIVQGGLSQGWTRRDPSGQMFLQLPAAIPWQQAFFISWQGQLVQVDQGGVQSIGACQFNPAFVPPPPWANVWSPPIASPNMGVQVGNSFVALPQQFAVRSENAPFAPPMLVSEARALQCWQASSGDRTTFGACMVENMLGQRERATYACVQQSPNSRAQVATCLVGALGGPNEEAIARVVGECQRRFGTNYQQYPLCMASQSINVGGDAGKLIACMQQQGAGGNIDVLGTAMCYGAGQFGLNAEAQIVAQCAVSTGGEPYAFAGCAGGQLTARELDKCFTSGVGGPNGCFGPNNTIVQALGSAGQLLEQQFGPNNTMVRAWNTAYHDVTQGPGPNNDVVRAFRNVGNEVNRTFGPNNDVRKAVERVVPRIRIRL
jgi:hypothetical protein